MLVHNGSLPGIRSVEGSSAAFDALRANALLSLLPGEELRALIAGARERTLQPGQALIEKGGPADSVSLILEGTAAVAQSGGDAEVLRAGALVGAEALAGRPRREATVRARGALKVLELPGPFASLVKAYPAFAAAIDARFKARSSVEIDPPRQSIEGPSLRADHDSRSASGPGKLLTVLRSGAEPQALRFLSGGLELRVEERDGVLVVPSPKPEDLPPGAKAALEETPRQFAMAALLLGVEKPEPTRTLAELSLAETIALQAEIDRAQAEGSGGCSKKFLRRLSAELAEALKTPALASARRTLSLEHPLLGDCLVRLEVGGRSETYAIEDGKLKHRSEPGERLRELMAVELSGALRPAEKEHLLQILTPKLERDAEQRRQITLEGRYETIVVRQGPDGAFETQRRGAWSPGVGPEEVLLFLRALRRAEPDEAVALSAKLFGRSGAAESGEWAGAWYGGSTGPSGEGYLGLYVREDGRYTDFAFGKKVVHKEPLDYNADRDSRISRVGPFAVTALCETAIAAGRSVAESLRPILDFGWSDGRFDLHDLRAHRDLYRGRVKGDGSEVEQWDPGDYAGSGYAWRKEGYTAPDVQIYGTYLSAYPYLAKELGWAPIRSSATIKLRDGEELSREQAGTDR